ncbi:bifunctional diguanylate cyclase/phosphodiesterase [Poseidonibacter ostreae]|jgi:EAL domain-containing protein (putative c-di-GMP-specific phosphodiesterase class I)/GGDEF domain-containing protein|uniref:EAL domain-containing protein n=1 Tax=Poseidonibacter ostreae TaxID=2654171 RepID=A0A6L4WRW0_9BACT|nr:EAL domain-containing protein [Poseidonibacter ostreae]KAB7884359.1 EAL domain-containing protein [Poseidonibacter ostreae]KAB7885338.1 EAL domain-containing protein [Poseidonibacter ostreae]KAB7888350.1 EAL domain-containing protein [Poseidonibacter ostreae]
MSLSKQLYIIIAFIFLMIFTGNFIISVKNTKEYLEIESITKAQDTATSLGMGLKSLLKDKEDPEIETIIKAISNRGFYKEIRLVDAYFTINETELIRASADLDDSLWKISNLKTDASFGNIEKITSDADISNQLSKLENEEIELNEEIEIEEDIYSYNPSEEYKNGGKITFSFTATNENGSKVDTSANLSINKIIAKATRDVKFDYIPSWFISMIPINLEEQNSEISNGWKTTAIIYVSANPGDAYAKLYDQVKGGLIYAIVAFIISMLILFIFVQYILKPLKRIEKLANNIAVGKFGTITELPWTSEIKSVAIAMNDMSTKIEAIINKLNRNLENSTKQLSQDELTKLSLKQSFETDMKNMFIHKSSGYIFVIKIFDLATFAKAHTNKEVNSFIKEFANILKNTTIDNKKAVAYRFFGSEFTLIAEKFSYEDAIKYTKILQDNLEKLTSKFDKKDIAHIGATPFNPIGTIPEMLQSANEAYEKATLIGTNEAYLRDSNDLSRDMESWRDLIFDIIDNSKFKVKYIGDATLLNQSDELVMQEAFTSACDKDGIDIPIGTFVSIAEKYEKIIDFDKKVVNKVIDYIKSEKVNHDISINLSLESINNTAFIAWLERTILQNKKIASQLVFSITAYAVAKDMGKFKFFADEMHQCGAKIIIKRFESKFIPLDNIKDFNLDYIRLARDYTCNICNDTSKQNFVESLQELSTLLNIKVFAENVIEEEDLEIIKSYNLYGASR